MTNEEIQQIFFLECEEALGAAESGLAACRDGMHDADTVNAVFRAVHSIKGGAGAFGFDALQAFTHAFETLLSDVRDGTLPITGPLVDLMLRAFDVLTDHVTAARGEGATPEDAAVIAALADAQTGQIAVPPSTDAAAPAATAQPDAGDSLDFDLDAMLGDIEAAIAEPTEAEAEDSADAADAPVNAGEQWIVTVQPRSGALANGSEPVLLLRELTLLGGRCIAVDVDSLPDLDTIDPGEGYLTWRFAIDATVDRAAIEEIFDFVGDDCGLTIDRGTPPPAREPAPAAETVPPPKPVATPAPDAVAVKTAEPAPAASPQSPVSTVKEAPAAKAAPASAPPAMGQSIRIDLFKLDKLIDTVGELVIAQAMMAQRLSGAGLTGIEELTMLDSLTRDIQESAMAIRAQPIGSVFSRVPRMLRELESTTGKRVRLEVAGEATELDKTVIERLGEPLTHLIRNAVDHGIETPDERVAAGKPAEGVLRLSAEHRSGRIVISIADDGKGIDRERVRAKAVERGLIATDASLSDEDIDNLIFAPGFSTAASVSNISGRGVGMDVVRQNVKELGGRISIESTPGQGSIFSLALPLTLAISDGMIVTVGDQTLVVPLANVVESLRPEADDVQGLGVGRQMLNVRGQFLPIVPVEGAIGARDAIQQATEGVLVIVDTEANGQAALLVDSILDQRQFVIKSLDANFRAVPGVAGATILGDGRVALILDVDAIVSQAVVTAGLREAA